MTTLTDKLTVWYGPMPESNGKTNWTAILHKGDIASGMTIDRSEYPDRVRYEADRARWLIGELAVEPFILDYDADKHSGYVAPAAPAQSPLTDEIFERQQAGFERCFETLGITDDRERSWSSLVLALTDVVTDAARYRFIRDDEYWQQSDRYWEAISAGGEKLDKTVDDGIKSNNESEEEEL